MMNRLIYMAFLLFLAGCSQKQEEIYLTPELAINYFRKVEEACNRDNGSLWGKNLSGPVMYVDRISRKIIASHPDKEGLLKQKDGVYTGIYPKELIISNTCITYGGTVYALAPIPVPEDEFRLVNRAIHGLFHCFQQSTGFTSSGYNTVNMDEKNARLWIKLEWKALKKTLDAEGEELQLAIRDALVFKGANQEFYQKYKQDEIKFETYEGLATFTYTLLAAGSEEQYRAKLSEYLDRVYKYPSYSRSYGSITGALYANLLYRRGFDFKIIRSESFDLADEVKRIYGIQLPEVCRDVAGSLALNYDVDIIKSEEEQREADIRERIHRQISTFTEKPVVLLELISPYFDFEDSDIHPMDTLGTLYSAIRISDNWGKLTVEKGGCLVSNNLKLIRITSRGYKTEKNRAEGDGWHLVLNNGWELIPVNDNYIITKSMH